MRLKDLIEKLQELDEMLETNPTVLINEYDNDIKHGDDGDWFLKEINGINEEFNKKDNQLIFYWDAVAIED